jgi:hypothetical protein
VILFDSTQIGREEIGAMAYDRMDAIGFHSIPSFFNIQ